MGKILESMTEEEQQAAKDFAKEHKISTEIAAVIWRSSDKTEERLEALKVMQAAAKVMQSPAAKKAALEKEINNLTEQLTEAEKVKNVPMMVKLRNLQQIKVNELKALGV